MYTLAQFKDLLCGCLQYISSTQIKDISEAVARNKGVLKKEQISDRWLWRFLGQQPTLSLQKVDPQLLVCMSAMDDREVIEKYFKVLKEVLDKHALQVYNVDELGIPLDHCSSHVVVKRGQQKVWYRTSGNKTKLQWSGA